MTVHATTRLTAPVTCRTAVPAAVGTTTPVAARNPAAAAAIGAALALAACLWQPGDLAAQSGPMKKSASAMKAPKPEGRPSKSAHGIVVVVNDEPVTAYQIDLRARLLALSTNVSQQAKAAFERLASSESLQARLKDLEREVVANNPGKTREQLIAIFKERQKQIGLSLQKQALESARASVMPKLRKAAMEELIDDRLKLQAAKRMGIEVTETDAKALVKSLAEKNKMTYDAFANHLKGMGVDVSTMLDRFKVQKAWRDVVTRRWGAQVAVTQRDIDELLSTTAAEGGQDTVELQLHKLTLAVPRADQAALTKRLAEAEALRRRFTDCKSLAQLAGSAPNVKLHDLNLVKPSTVGEPTRALLLSAKDNEVLPPVASGDGVELYVVCGRKAARGSEELKSRAMAALQAKQLEIFAQRHLRNLRQEANIEYR